MRQRWYLVRSAPYNVAVYEDVTVNAGHWEPRCVCETVQARSPQEARRKAKAAPQEGYPPSALIVQRCSAKRARLLQGVPTVARRSIAAQVYRGEEEAAAQAQQRTARAGQTQAVRVVSPRA